MGRFSAVVFLIACGPGVDFDHGEDSSSSSSATTTTTTTTTTSSSSSSSSSTSSSTSSSSSTSDSESGSESGTTGICSCEGSPIGLDDELDEGLTPAELLEQLALDDVRWTWPGIAADPESSAAATAAHAGGEVIDEVGGCCGSFLCGPCPATVTLQANLTIATADGRLDDTFTAVLESGTEGIGMVFRTEAVPLRSLAGTLASETFDDEGIPFFPTSVFLDLYWDFDGEIALNSAYLYGDDGAQQVLLGRYQPG